MTRARREHPQTDQLAPSQKTAPNRMCRHPQIRKAHLERRRPSQDCPPPPGCAYERWRARAHGVWIWSGARRPSRVLRASGRREGPADSSPHRSCPRPEDCVRLSPRKKGWQTKGSAQRCASGSCGGFCDIGECAEKRYRKAASHPGAESRKFCLLYATRPHTCGIAKICVAFSHIYEVIVILQGPVMSLFVRTKRNSQL